MVLASSRSSEIPVQPRAPPGGVRGVNFTYLVEGLVRVCQVEEVLEFQVVEHHEPDLFGHVREVVAVSPAELQYVLEGVQAVHVGYLVCM